MVWARNRNLYIHNIERASAHRGQLIWGDSGARLSFAGIRFRWKAAAQKETRARTPHKAGGHRPGARASDADAMNALVTGLRDHPGPFGAQIASTGEWVPMGQCA